MTAMSAQSASNANAANPFPDLPASLGPGASPQPPRPHGPTLRSYRRPRFGDYSRTRFESRVAFAGPEADAEEIATPSRQFSLLEITSGFPEDSREADERVETRRLREARARVKAARAMVATTPGLAQTLARDWGKGARFFARWGITEAQFRWGVPPGSGARSDATEITPYDRLAPSGRWPLLRFGIRGVL